MQICGQCNQQFEQDNEFADHVCPVTGVKITEPQSMGPNWADIQKASLARGEAKNGQSDTPAATNPSLKEEDLIQVVKAVKTAP